jgi:hypothetical protein
MASALAAMALDDPADVEYGGPLLTSAFLLAAPPGPRLDERPMAVDPLASSTPAENN